MNIKKKIRHAIRWFMPFGLVRWYAQSRQEEPTEPSRCDMDMNFMSDYRRYIMGNNHVRFTQKCPFDTIVSVNGFGFSGSGAVMDLLREYSNTYVIGTVDYEGSAASRDMHFEEVDILRLAGGLFEVERFLRSNNVFQNDALLHRVVAQIEHSEIFRKIPSTREYFYEYLHQICDILACSPKWQYYNQFLDYKQNNDISINQYRSICRRLLNSIFSIIKSDSQKQILVLDQFINDFEFDVVRYKEYVPNLKIIMIYRDPRDVYAFANIKNVEWIPHHSLEVFIKWNNIIYKNYNCKEHDLYYALQFERLIEEYEKVVPVLERYIGVEDAVHNRKGECLNPAESRKNIHLWKKDINNQEIYNNIKMQLSQLCYDKD